MNKKKKRIIVIIGFLVLLTSALVIGIMIYNSVQADTNSVPKLVVNEQAGNEYHIEYEAVAGYHVINVYPGGSAVHHLNDRTGISKSYHNGLLISTEDIGKLRSEVNNPAISLDYSDKKYLDDFIHKLWSKKVSVDELPKELSDTFEIAKLNDAYEVKRLSIDRVISSGPSRYIYKYDAPLDEQPDGPTSLVAYNDGNGQIMIEFSAPSGRSEIELAGDELQLKFTHDLRGIVTIINYTIGQDTSNLEPWTVSDSVKSEADEALLDDYLADLPLELGDGLPALPGDLAERYVVHRPLEGGGFIIEHLPRY